MPAGMSDPTRLRVTSPDGRRLDVELSGTGDRAVLFHTGTPSSGEVFGAAIDDGTIRGLRHIAYSRPGYGGSDRHPSRTVADCVTDVVAILDELEVERCLTVGWSGGGPHALACAALLPDRVDAAATIASVAPRDADGLDWLAGMGEENIAEFAALEAGPQALEQLLTEYAVPFSHVTADQVRAELGDLLSAVDAAVLTGEVAEHMAHTSRGAVAAGAWGWFDDDIACLTDWGFDLGTIRRPVTIWQGTEDRFVPPSHAEWLAARIPGARLELRPDDGHLTLGITSYGDVLDALLRDDAACSLT
jgi:pimeloyl-ACP methyl ester carboxylesterase